MRKRHDTNDLGKEYFIEDAEKYYSKKENVHSVHPILALTLVVYLIGLYGLAYLIEESLPTPLKLSDEKNHPDAFIAERAQNDLKELLDIGPRTTGSYENEVLTVDFLKRKLTEIQQQAHFNQKVEIDIQITSGSYYLDFKPYGAISSYGNIQNVLVKLHSKNNSKHSLLVNTHFDTVIGSPGGSDAGIMCAVALEILRKLSRLPKAPEHNIIFIFNGAEETPLKGSHGFVQNHIWAKEVEVLVNLDAGGSGGKELLQLVGPRQPWLLKYYSKIPHPHGQVAGEEVYQSGIIPSNTDFKIFSDFGKIIGLEILFYKDGFRYHTVYDGFSNIQPGTYQHVGDNMLSLIGSLANAPELTHVSDQPKEDVVFYDFLELVFISYTKTTALALSIVSFIVSLVITFRSFGDFNLRFSFSSIMYLILTFGAILLGWNVSAIPVFAVATILDLLGFNLRWYSNVWILIGLYGAPIVCCCCSIIVILNKFYENSHLSINAQTQIQIHLVRIIWGIVLLLGTFSGIRSIYPVLILIFFQTLTAGIIQIFSLQHSAWKTVYILGTSISTLVLMKKSQQILAGIMPVCGRFGSHRNPEVYIAALSLLIAILIFSSYVPLITLVRRPRKVLRGSIGIFVAFSVLAFTPLTFPYTNNPESPRAQRFSIYHGSRVFRDNTNEVYKNDSGYVVFSLDRNSPGSVKNYVKGFSRAQSMMDDCENGLLCGISVMDPRVLVTLPYTTFIPAEPPIIQDPITLKLNSQTSLTDSTTRFEFTASGPSQCTFFVSARPNTRLLKTNLVTTLPPNPIFWNNRPVYVIIYTWGREKTPLNLTLDFETPSNWNRPIFDIVMIGNHKDDKTNVKTSQFVEFLSEFPEWTTSQVWLSQYESWVY